MFKKPSKDKRSKNIYQTRNAKLKFAYLDTEFEGDNLNTFLDADNDAMRRILKHLCLSGTFATHGTNSRSDMQAHGC